MTAIPVHVEKRDHRSSHILTYTGTLIENGASWVCMEARFALPDKDAGYHRFRQGDRFVEWFYSDRAYNIFAMYDVDDNHLKGWYCNITRPAIITISADRIDVTADDLALDVFVRPDGTVLVLDEDEFAALNLPAADHAAALASLADLQTRIARREPPFDLS